MTKITRDILEGYLNCKTKGHLKLTGEHGTPSDYEAMTSMARAASREETIGKLVARFGEADACRGTAVTATTLKNGAPLLADIDIEHESLSIRFDALKRADGASKLGDHHYLPVLHNHGTNVRRPQKILLAVLGLTLARVQGLKPAVGLIARGSEGRLGKVRLDARLYRQAEQVLDELKRLQEGGKPPRLLLNKHCQVCEFRQRCRAAAVEKDDLSLLSGLSAKKVADLNAKGIFTVTQYSYTFHPRRMKRLAEKGRKHDHSLQALAIRENTVYVAQRPELPAGKPMLYLDVEGLPDEGWFYLIGLTLVQGDTRGHLSFWADNEADEAVIWGSFLATVEPLETFVLLHYGSYEGKFLEEMEARHGGDPVLLARLKASSVNVLSLIYSRVYFPVHSNDLKSVAGCLGFRWSSHLASGLQSIAWRYGWEANHDDRIKQLLLTYNQEDQEALEQVTEMLRRLGAEQGQSGDDTGPRVAGLEGLGDLARRKFSTGKFALPEFAHLTKCAYFDYQRDKVLCRTNPTVKKVLRGRKKPTQRTYKVNREVECGVPTVCPNCGLDDFGVQSRYQKLVIDLRAFRGGIKSWVTRYKVNRYRCRQCRKGLYPDDYQELPYKFGWGVCQWVAFATITLRQTNDAIAESLDDLFGISASHGYLSKMRHQAAEYYRPTYEALLSALRNGQLVHADETKVRLKHDDGYVWVFANPETVAYIYSPTRDGDTPQKMLAGFKGVLVSDFYAAYDSIDCPQQKCLIHLIRDINEDLLKNPFDGELKQQAGRFAALLQAVVATVDRFGLKKYHLKKHKREVDGFFKAENQAVYQSELARNYQKRLLKHQNKLFTFLDYDGVPWNNNNAENAVKQFASRRKVMGKAFAESGIRDYLLLLSIYQTLRYRNVSFWQFLLSGETDLEAFCRRGPKKNQSASPEGTKAMDVRGRTIAIGDIHGCSMALRALLEAIRPNRCDTVVTLGNYIDHGPDSKGVIRLLLALLRRCTLVPLKGDHEEMFLAALEGSNALRCWLRCGGDQTLRSYNVDHPRAIPRLHCSFLNSGENYHETDTHIFTHAGYQADQPLKGESGSVLRCQSLNEVWPSPHVSGKVAIVGHTPQKNGEILDLGHLVCIDTNCHAGGWLTALDVGSGRWWQANEKGEVREGRLRQVTGAPIATRVQP